MAQLTEISGNIFDLISDNGLYPNAVVLQQVNCQGIMEGGFALQVKQKYPEVYLRYLESVAHNRDISLLSDVNVVHLEDSLLTFINMFGQYECGSLGRDTSYDALQKCFERASDLFHMPSFARKSVILVPKNMSCGLAGGSWNVVYAMLEDFAQSLPERIQIIIVNYVAK